MLGTLVRCSVAAIASIALLVAFVSAPEGFTKAQKPKRAERGDRSPGDRHRPHGKDAVSDREQASR
jgi:hypothetical protein